MNRIIDRNIDRKNPRTQARHLASGTMRLWEAWAVAAIGLALYLGSARLLSAFCFQWSWIPLIGFVAYPYFKRFTKWTHVGLGLVWSLVPLGGFFAVKPSLDGIWPAAALGLFSVFWLAGFDIIYALMDEDFDRRTGLYSLPACWGSERAMKAAAVFHFLAFVVLVVLYSVCFSGPLTVMLLFLTGALLVMEQKFSGYVDIAFFQMNAIIGFVVLFFVVSGLKGV
jgi:4-hydroxybenzoate polyprenyltransferase